MIHKLKVFSGLIFLLLFALAMPTYGAGDVPRINPEELKGMLGSPDLVLMDARLTRDWRKSDRKIVGAIRINPHDVSTWAVNYSKDQKIVLYDSGVNEATSASVAGRLIELGYTDVKVLKGNWNGWKDMNFPTEAKY